MKGFRGVYIFETLKHTGKQAVKRSKDYDGRGVARREPNGEHGEHTECANWYKYLEPMEVNMKRYSKFRNAHEPNLSASIPGTMRDGMFIALRIARR